MRIDTKIITLVIANLFFCAGCSHSVESTNPPHAIKGVLDLSRWAFEKDGPVPLSGEYEFYWQKHLTPDDFSKLKQSPETHYIDVPNHWKGHPLNGLELPSTGYATYRLTILLNDSLPEKLALKFLDMGTAYRVFANGETIVSVGKVDTSKNNTVPAYFPQVVNLTPVSPTLELVYHVSNFHHNHGGAWEVIHLGAMEQIMQLRQHRLRLDLILFGAIMMIGFFNIAVFRLRNDLSSLYFGLFCLAIAVRLLTTVERYLLSFFPEINWEWFVKIEYLSYYLSVPLFALFISGMFKRDFHKSIVSFIIIFGLIFSLMVCLVPARIFTQILVIYNLFTALCMVYALSVLGLAAFGKSKRASVILVGFLCLIAAVTNDILDANAIIQTGHYVHYGVFLFIFAHSYMLSFRYSEEIVNSQQKLRAVMSHLYSIAERERTVIARDVHDELGGALTSLKIDLSVLERKIREHSKRVNLTSYLQEIRSMKELIDDAMSNMRELIKKLRPGTLDKLGLVSALKAQLQEFQKHTHLDCEFICHAAEPLHIKEEKSIAVFRIFQESLTNIARHANANKVVVSIDIRKETIDIVITDDGIGIPKKKLRATKTFGILGMRERALMFGGSVKIHGRKRGGTTVRIIVPIGECENYDKNVDSGRPLIDP